MLKKIEYFSLFLIIILSAFSCHSPVKKNILFDAGRLCYGLTPEKVIRIVGQKPDSAFNKTIIGKKRYILLYFNKDSSEFRFDKNKLLEVIVNKPGFPFAAHTITAFGLPYREPSEYDSAAFIKWSDSYKNFDVINFYLVGSRMDNRSVRYKIYLRMKVDNLLQ